MRKERKRRLLGFSDDSAFAAEFDVRQAMNKGPSLGMTKPLFGKREV